MTTRQIHNFHNFYNFSAVSSFIFLLSSVINPMYSYSAAAPATPSFASREACYASHATTTNTNDIKAAEIFCKGKYSLTAADSCADKKLYDYKKQNSVSSADESRYLQNYKRECLQAQAKAQQDLQVSAQRAVQAEQRQAQIAQRDSQVVAAKQAQVNQQTSQANLADTARILTGLAPIIEKAEEKYDKLTSTAAEEKSAAPAAKPTANTAAGAGVAGAQALPATEAAGGVTAAAGAAGGVAPGEIPDQITGLTPNAIEARVGLNNDAAAAKDVVGAEPVDKIKKAADIGTNVPVIQSKLTLASKEQTTALQTQIIGVLTKAATALSPLPIFLSTVWAIDSVQKHITEYEAAKTSCTTVAEVTETVCFEGTSPMAIAAKTAINIAGPVIALVGSAQKACSKTATITGYAALGLTVAKGICIGSQLTCKTSCGLALLNLKKSIAAWSATVEAAVVKDTAAANTCAPECTAIIPVRTAAAKAAIASIQLLTENEALPVSLGAAGGLSASCALKAFDVAMFAVNIANLTMANKSAKQCEAKLAASSGEGSTVTATQYCETAANANSEFCKCQKDPKAQGCAGHFATEKDINPDIAGTNLKGGAGGPSSFASASKTNADIPKNSALADNVKNDSDASDELGAKDPSTEANSAGQGGSVGGAPNNFSNDTAAADAATNEKKKWSFGAFANGVSNMFGGGRGSKAPGPNGNSKSAQDQQNQALQRKIASDKLAGEVTSASGKSNWEKVRQTYTIKKNTLLSE